MPLSSLIAQAYGPNGLLLRRNQIEGGPDWTRVDGFDIDAKAPTSAGFDTGATSPNDSRIQAMIRTLLTERFKLVAHMEHRTIPTYSLKVMRTDGRLGPSMHALQLDCAATRTLAANARQAGTSVWDSRQVCLVAVGAGGTSLTSYGGTTAQLANVLGTMADRPVVDATGLTGQFEMSATFEPMRSVAADSSTGTSLFTALREQLGLELNPDKQEVDVLVIDHVEHPTED